MKRTIGLILFLIGMFVLGLGIRRLLSTHTTIISPIPNDDTVRVIRVTTTPQ